MFKNSVSETHAMFVSKELAMKDRKEFVENLGVLFAQTREGIKKTYLDDNDHVHIVYSNDYEKEVNVACDSYMAIIRDVAKGIDL